MLHNLDKQIAEAKADLEELLRQKKQLESEQPQHRLAIVLHDLKCHSEHTEHCGWYYEIQGKTHDWTQWTHARFLDQALEVMAELPDKTVDEIIRIARVL